MISMPPMCGIFFFVRGVMALAATRLIEKRYMLIFQIVDNTVYADYVVDCRQDYGWLIR